MGRRHRRQGEFSLKFCLQQMPANVMHVQFIINSLSMYYLFNSSQGIVQSDTMNMKHANLCYKLGIQIVLHTLPLQWDHCLIDKRDIKSHIQTICIIITLAHRIMATTHVINVATVAMMWPRVGFCSRNKEHVNSWGAVMWWHCCEQHSNYPVPFQLKFRGPFWTKMFP